MVNKKVITKTSPKVIDFIKAKIVAKKERHKALARSIDPTLIKELQKMKKIEC